MDWKTDQDVVNEFGMPKQVIADTLKGKVYYYEVYYYSGGAYAKTNKIVLKYVSPSVVEYPKGVHPTFESTTFYFDSLNKVRLVLSKDTIDKGTIYKNKSGKAF
jgi:hypothetical protein